MLPLPARWPDWLRVKVELPRSTTHANTGPVSPLPAPPLTQPQERSKGRGGEGDDWTEISQSLVNGNANNLESYVTNINYL